MKGLIVALAAALVLAACTNSAPSDNHAEPERECRYHGGAQEVGCLYKAAELAKLTKRKDYPVWVYHGVLQKHADHYLLRVRNESDAPFMVLEVAAYPVSAAKFGLGPLVGWRTRVVGRYTSSDIAYPGVPGASGTLIAVHIGYLYDGDRPQGPYANLRGDAVEGLEEAKTGD